MPTVHDFGEDEAMSEPHEKALRTPRATLPGCLTIEDREAITAACRTIHEILLKHNLVKSNWPSLTGRATDGRVIVHKFTIGGYVKSYPAGYDPATAGAAPGAETDDV